MLIRFWCDSDITFLRGLHKQFVKVLYFSIINVLWLINLFGLDGDTSFAPEANLFFCVLFRGKKGAVCGKWLTFLYTSPYEHVNITFEV